MATPPPPECYGPSEANRGEVEPCCSASCNPRGHPVAGGPLPFWVSACVWRLLSPPYRVGEISYLSCDAYSALFSSAVRNGSSARRSSPAGRAPAAAAGPADGPPGVSDLLDRWWQLEDHAREAAERRRGDPDGPQPPSQAEEEAQDAAEALLKASGGPYGVTCSSIEESAEAQGAPLGGGPLALALCECVLWGLHAAANRVFAVSCDTRPACQGPLSLPPDEVGPSRMLLTITGRVQSGNAAAERRLLSLRGLLLLPPQALPPATALLTEPVVASRTAGQHSAAVAWALEELRASRLPLLLHPKATEIWALRRHQLRLCIQLLLQQQLLLVLQTKATSAAAGTDECAAVSQANAALQQECRQLFKEEDMQAFERLMAPQVTPPIVARDALLLQLLRSELSLTSWHLRSRSHHYQAAEHGHRVLQLFLTEVSAAAAGGSSSPPETVADDGQQPQRQPNGLPRLVSTIEAEERRFWKQMCQTVPSHFAGGQQLLRLLAVDLQRLMQQQLPSEEPLRVSWLSAQLSPGGAAAARAAETAEEGRRVLALFPACEAAWRICTYSFVSLMDWSAAAAKECQPQQQALKTVALPLLTALVVAEKQWAQQMPPCRFGTRHVETLEEELQLLAVPDGVSTSRDATESRSI